MIIKCIIFAVKDTNMGKIFFTSDLHFNHDREFVWGDRGFKIVEEMNEAIVLNWNSVIDEDDTVYVLGDLMLGGDDGTKNGVGLLKCLNGHKRVVLGNHDSDRRINEYMKIDGIESISWAEMIKYNGRRFFVTHFPCETSNMESDPKACIINIHGHTHSKEKFEHGKPYQYNCALDAHGNKPVSIDEIIEDFHKEIEKYQGQL